MLLYPFLAVLYPILSLYATNIDQVEWVVVLRPLLLSLMGVAILQLILSKALRNQEKAALLATAIIVLFFSYGHVYTALKSVSLGGQILGRHRYLVPIWAALLVASLLLIRGRESTKRVNRLALVITASLALMSFLSIGTYSIRTLKAREVIDTTAYSGDGLRLDASLVSGMPDIYYIILDTYPRADTLANVYGYDNSEFLESLEERGFSLAECSQSNYARTEISLASSLNYAYLEDLSDQFIPENTDKSPLKTLIGENAVRSHLAELGYTFVAFDTGISYTKIKDADLYLRPTLGLFQDTGMAGGLTGYEVLLLRTTLVSVLLDAGQLASAAIRTATDPTYELHRQRALFIFDELGRLSNNPDATFVFAHIMPPHSPFIFGPNGQSVVRGDISYLDPDPDVASRLWWKNAYIDQLRYVNSRILEFIDLALAGSNEDPIIIIQGDHGPEGATEQDRMRILNAYYLPGISESLVYPSISPVNSFRLILSTYFGAQLDLLEDVARFSTFERPYDFSEILNVCPFDEG